MIKMKKLKKKYNIFYMKFLYGFIIGMIIMYLFINSKNKEIQFKNQRKMVIKKLIRQAARWSTAAKQDKNSMIAVLHANYGAGYLWALKDIVTTDIIEKEGNINIMKFENEIIQIQDEATKKMAKLCPKYAPEKSYLTTFSGEG